MRAGSLRDDGQGDRARASPRSTQATSSGTAPKGHGPALDHSIICDRRRFQIREARFKAFASMVRSFHDTVTLGPFPAEGESEVEECPNITAMD
jgi:hypothetical protein